MRTTLATICGLVAAVFLIFVLEATGHLLWPPPAWMDASDPESIRRALPLLPLGAVISLTAAWILGTFTGSWLGTLIARRALPACIVGAFVASSALITLFLIPHPIWYWIVALVLVPLAAYAGALLACRKIAKPS